MHSALSAILELQTIAVTIYAMTDVSKVSHQQSQYLNVLLCLWVTFVCRRHHIADWHRLVDEECKFCRADMGESQVGIKISIFSESENLRQLQHPGAFCYCRPTQHSLRG
jgi:hypothetical protein